MVSKRSTLSGRRTPEADGLNGGRYAKRKAHAGRRSHRGSGGRNSCRVPGADQLPRRERRPASGQFPEALHVYMEMVKSRTGDVSDMTLAMLHDIRTATLD
jgi:hypothetical protein